MTVSRPAEIGTGDEVRLGDTTATILAVTAEGIQLRDVTGAGLSLTRGELLTSPGFQVVTARTAPLSPSGLLDGLSQPLRVPFPPVASDEVPQPPRDRRKGRVAGTSGRT